MALPQRAIYNPLQNSSLRTVTAYTESMPSSTSRIDAIIFLSMASRKIFWRHIAMMAHLSGAPGMTLWASYRSRSVGIEEVRYEQH